MPSLGPFFKEFRRPPPKTCRPQKMHGLSFADVSAALAFLGFSHLHTSIRLGVAAWGTGGLGYRPPGSETSAKRPLARPHPAPLDGARGWAGGTVKARTQGTLEPSKTPKASLPVGREEKLRRRPPAWRESFAMRPRRPWVWALVSGLRVSKDAFYSVLQAPETLTRV